MRRTSLIASCLLAWLSVSSVACGSGAPWSWVGLGDDGFFEDHLWDRPDYLLEEMCAVYQGRMAEEILADECSVDADDVDLLGPGTTEIRIFWADGEEETQQQTCLGGEGHSFHDVCVHSSAEGQYFWDEGPSTPWLLAYLTEPLAFGDLKYHTILFWEAGQFHDYCYHHGNATYGYSKDTCDRLFYERMLDICAASYPEEDERRLDECALVAEFGYEITETFGKDSFEALNTVVDYLPSMPVR